jgi:hypothetical protein
MYLSIIAGEVVRKMNSFAHDPRSNSQVPESNEFFMVVG